MTICDLSAKVNPAPGQVFVANTAGSGDGPTCGQEYIQRLGFPPNDHKDRLVRPKLYIIWGLKGSILLHLERGGVES